MAALTNRKPDSFRPLRSSFQREPTRSIESYALSSDFQISVVSAAPKMLFVSGVKRKLGGTVPLSQLGGDGKHLGLRFQNPVVDTVIHAS